LGNYDEAVDDSLDAVIVDYPGCYSNDRHQYDGNPAHCHVVLVASSPNISNNIVSISWHAVRNGFSSPAITSFKIIFPFWIKWFCL